MTETDDDCEISLHYCTETNKCICLTVEHFTVKYFNKIKIKQGLCFIIVKVSLTPEDFVAISERVKTVIISPSKNKATLFVLLNA